MNVVMMLGTLSRDPEIRALPSGDLLMSFDLTTRRGDDPAESAPVVWFEPSGSSASLGAGARVLVVGRVRRRWYRSGGTTHSRTEVVAERVVPARQATRCRTLVDRRLAEVAAAMASLDGS